MIISKTPLRISFVGGGSDIASFYKTEPGAIISTTINKYIYITLHERFHGKFRLSYSETETVDDINDFKHPIGKEALKFFKIDEGIEVHSMADIPAKTGLGSSGAYTVGLLNALATYKGRSLSAKELADFASIVEIEMAKRPIGKQDQYAQAYGGLNFIQFNADESVTIEPIKLSAAKIRKLESNLLLFYTGITGSSLNVLLTQTKQLAKNHDTRMITSQMVDLAKELKEQLQKGKLDSFGRLLHENWLLKKKIGGGISNRNIDAWYERAMQEGAHGGKICGAGGRGFLLLYAPAQYHKKISRALSDLRQVDFAFEPKGSTIIYNN